MYIQALWDRLADHPEDVPVPQWHRDRLERRVRPCPARSRTKGYFDAIGIASPSPRPADCRLTLDPNGVGVRLSLKLGRTRVKVTT